MFICHLVGFRLLINVLGSFMLFSRLYLIRSHGFCIGHVVPEAQVGGPIALVRDGDAQARDEVHVVRARGEEDEVVLGAVERLGEVHRDVDVAVSAADEDDVALRAVGLLGRHCGNFLCDV